MTIDPILFRAKLAERAERYEEMTQLMKQAIEKGSRGDAADIRNLLSVAYKNCLAEKRTAWRLLFQIGKKELAKGLHHGAQCVADYRKEIEKEICSKCDEGIGLADRLLSNSSDAQERAFLTKLKADYNRYIADLPTERQERATQAASKFYDEALSVGLPANHHVVLATMLNKAIFYYEVLDKRSQAIAILEEASRQSEPVSETNRRNASVIATLISDNLDLWRAGQR